MQSVLPSILILLIAFLPAQQTANKSEAVRVRYDRFKDATTVSTGPLLLSEDWQTASDPLSQLRMQSNSFSGTFEFKFKGSVRKNPPVNIVMTISSFDRWLTFPASGSSFIALVDGKRLVLPKIVGSHRSWGTVRLPLSIFRRLISGKKVEIQVDGIESTIPAETLVGLREFESYTRRANL